MSLKIGVFSLIKEIYWVKKSKTERYLQYLTILCIFLCFLLILHYSKWIILTILCFLTFYQKKDEFLNQKNVVKQMIVVDNENQMYILYNDQIRIIGFFYIFTLFFLFLFQATSLFMIAFDTVVFINLMDFIDNAQQRNYRNNRKEIHHNRKYVRKILKVSSDEKGIYTMEMVRLNDEKDKIVQTCSFSKQYENYQELISRIDSLCEN